MKYHKLPHSSLEVSKICLGTMTFGEQNSQAEAFNQLDYAIERGVNFIDTAEMYPVPPKQQTQLNRSLYWQLARKVRQKRKGGISDQSCRTT